MFVLVINPGSTSTKVAVYEDAKELHKKAISHSRDELSRFGSILDQLDYRHGLVTDFISEIGFALSKLDCVISRGGSPPDIRSGATIISDALVTALRERPKEPHPACLGPIIASRIAKEVNIPAYMYDPITADELNPLARIFGVKGIEHDSMCHVLNSRAMGIAVAKESGRAFEEMTFIVAHFGGGNSV
ncbi:MAG: butyrate kinase, partial [Synergistaceae bacterium]|nr:butyrate kinase [Synergistaceae bacterium]